MKVYFHEDFYGVYTSDPAAAAGRMEPIVMAAKERFDLISFGPASEEDILAVHSKGHIDYVRRQGLYEISALAAGGAMIAAKTGLSEASFAIIRPPGHHASADSCWGFCYFNNMAIALTHLTNNDHIKTAFLLDFDLHYGDGNVNILGSNNNIRIYNPENMDRGRYLIGLEQELEACRADMIAVSAGFDNHQDDWGGLLTTGDYWQMGGWVANAAKRNNGGCFGILEGGYNHNVLGQNVLAFLKGMAEV
jgi:acetoin utilization deacetylase AcuC-like enzyme